MDASADPVLGRLRDEIAATDRAIVESLNARLELVIRLRKHKEAHGLPFVDDERERHMLEHVRQANRGPLSAGGLEEIYRAIVELTKREVSGSP